MQEQSHVNPTGPQLFTSVNSDPGDHKCRQIDTRTKEKPSGNDLENTNKTVEGLMRQTAISPVENPIGYLWIANCALYSTVIAFLLIKGCKKEHSGHTTMQVKSSWDTCPIIMYSK